MKPKLNMGMEQQEKEKLIRQAVFCTNAAYLMADVADSYVLEAASALGQIGKSVKYGELKRFKSVSNVARQLREMTKKLSSPIYGLEESGIACDNSDFIKECVTLIATRCGDDEESKQKMLAAIREAVP